MGLISIFTKKNVELEEKLNKKIEDLEQIIERKDKEISDLINEIDNLNQSMGDINSNLNSKQLELIEKNMKDMKEENERLKQVIEKYNLSSKKEKYYYKVDIKKFFSASRFIDLANAIMERGIFYLQDLTIEKFDSLPQDIKNLEDGRNKFLKYLNKDFIQWEVVTYLNKGERVSKIYNKNRKLIVIFAESNIEFMEDLREFDFWKLINLGFKDTQIEEFIGKRDEYYKKRRVAK